MEKGRKSHFTGVSPSHPAFARAGLPHDWILEFHPCCTFPLFYNHNCSCLDCLFQDTCSLSYTASSYLSYWTILLIFVTMIFNVLCLFTQHQTNLHDSNIKRQNKGKWNNKSSTVWCSVPSIESVKATEPTPGPVWLMRIWEGRGSVSLWRYQISKNICHFHVCTSAYIYCVGLQH